MSTEKAQPHDRQKTTRRGRTAAAVGIVYFLIWYQGSSTAPRKQLLTTQSPSYRMVQVKQHSNAVAHTHTVALANPRLASRNSTGAQVPSVLDDAVRDARTAADAVCKSNSDDLLILVQSPVAGATEKHQATFLGGMLFECSGNKTRLSQPSELETAVLEPHSYPQSPVRALQIIIDLGISVLIVLVVNFVARVNTHTKQQQSSSQQASALVPSNKEHSSPLAEKGPVPAPVPALAQPSSTAPSEPMTTPSIDSAISLALQNKLRLYALESHLNCSSSAVTARRQVLHTLTTPGNPNFSISALPVQNFDYDRVRGSCCENVIGYLPVPVGVAGPLNINGSSIYLPMATTEGALVASTNRGCTAINASGGVTTVLLADGMTRGPCVSFPSLSRAAAAKQFLDSSAGLEVVQTAFNSTSRFGKLQSVKSTIAGSDLFIRFKATTGDAMGMNMISKGCEAALTALSASGFSDMSVTSLSGNYCTDKKSAALNWIDGRGKSVAAQVIIPASILQKVLKIDVDSVVALNTSKNLIGSAMAGALGGFNAHAANIVSAIFLATGQDIAQNVESSSCITVMKKTSGGDLEMSITMPSIEVGTVGGGTVLEAQGAMLELLGVKGASRDEPGANSQLLAQYVAAGVLAGELSLLSALASGALVKSHLALNRK